MVKFSEEQKWYIAKAFGKNTSSAAVRLEFFLHYRVTRRTASKYPTYIFTRVNSSFEQNNSVLRKKKGLNVRPSKRFLEKIEEVRTTVYKNSLRSLRKSKHLFDVPQTTLYWILKDDLNYRFYHVKSVQPLTNAHKKQKTEFCRWLLEQRNPERLVMNVIWTDEKYFCLNQKPHRKNEGIWSNERPRENVESNNQTIRKWCSM